MLLTYLMKFNNLLLYDSQIKNSIKYHKSFNIFLFSPLGTLKKIDHWIIRHN